MAVIEKVPLNKNVEPGAIHYLPQRIIVKSEMETIIVLSEIFYIKVKQVTN